MAGAIAAHLYQGADGHRPRRQDTRHPCLDQGCPEIAAGDHPAHSHGHRLGGLERRARHQYELRRADDPLLELAIMNAAGRKGVVLIAAAGNAGPKSAPFYPAADPNVIAVTATDQNDKLFRGQSRAAYRGRRAWRRYPGAGAERHLSDDDRHLGCRRPSQRHCRAVAREQACARPRGRARDPDIERRQECRDRRGATASSAGGVVDPSQALLDLDAKFVQEQDSPSAKPAPPKPAAPPSSWVPVATRSAPTPATAKQPAAPTPPPSSRRRSPVALSASPNLTAFREQGVHG